MILQGYVGPAWIYLPATYLELEGGYSISQIKYEAKMFPTELLKITLMPILYLYSHVAKISTPFGLHVPPWRKFIEDISLPFGRPHGCLSPISLSYFLSNRLRICHP